MTAETLIQELHKNKLIIELIMKDAPSAFIHFENEESRWSPLKIICHLVDEEKEDFRARIQFTKNTPETSPPPIDPEGWVIKRAY